VGTSPSSSHQHEKKKKGKDFTIVSLDESFFFYDSLVRRVWIDAKKRPVVRIMGSHEISCLFGAVSMDSNKQLFRQYDRFNTETFLNFLKIIHHRFQRCYLFMDKAPPHFKSRKVKDYLEENRDTLIPVYLPTASPEFMMLEQVWNIAKRELLVLQHYSSFDDFKQKISCYFRTKRFGLNMRNYLLRTV
jgi:transposase